MNHTEIGIQNINPLQKPTLFEFLNNFKILKCHSIANRVIVGADVHSMFEMFPTSEINRKIYIRIASLKPHCCDSMRCLKNFSVL